MGLVVAFLRCLPVEIGSCVYLEATIQSPLDARATYSRRNLENPEPTQRAHLSAQSPATSPDHTLILIIKNDTNHNTRSGPRPDER